MKIFEPVQFSGQLHVPHEWCANFKGITTVNFLLILEENIERHNWPKEHIFNHTNASELAPRIYTVLL